MVGRLLVGFVWLNLQISVSWQVDFQWGSCGSIFSFLCHGRQIFNWVCVAQSSFLCHGWQTFSGVRVAQSLVFCVMVGRLLVGCRVAQSLVFCVMVGRLLVGFVWLNLQFSVSWQVDFQWGSCGSQCVFSWVRVSCHGGRLLVGFVWLFSFLCLYFQFLCHVYGRLTYSGVRVAQSLVFCVMVGRHLVGFVWLNLQFCVMAGRFLVRFVWLNLFFLCHCWQTFSGVRVAQSLVFCVMVGRFLGGFVWLNLVFCVMVGRLLVGFVWLNLQVSVSWQVDFQWGSCGSIFSFLRHGWYTCIGVREAQSLVFCVKVGNFQWVRVAQSLVFCLMVGRLLGGFVWLNLQLSTSWFAYLQ